MDEHGANQGRTQCGTDLAEEVIRRGSRTHLGQGEGVLDDEHEDLDNHAQTDAEDQEFAAQLR